MPLSPTTTLAIALSASLLSVLLLYLLSELLFWRWTKRPSRRAEGETINGELKRARKRKGVWGSVRGREKIWAVRLKTEKKKKKGKGNGDGDGRLKRGKSAGDEEAGSGADKKLSLSSLSSSEEEEEDITEERQDRDGERNGWIHPLPELVRGEGRGMGLVKDDDGGGKGERRVPGGWYRDV